MNYSWWQLVLVILVSYAFGNIFVARFISQKKKKDITKIGSGNVGATNMLRNFGFKLGLLTFSCDILKGFIPALVAFKLFGNNVTMLYISGLSTIVGHIFPVAYKFKGGKGIATMIGVFFVAAPITTLVVCFIGFLFWLSFEYGSLSSFWCVTALTVSQGIRAKGSLSSSQALLVCLLLFAVFLVTWFAHRSNIQRLLVGKESKLSLIRSTKKSLK